MTDAELRKPDQELIESEMAELIKEARHKIKPVIHAMSKEELESLVKDLKTAKKDSQLTITVLYHSEVLEKIGINLEELRKIQDKHYDVDIEYELTRDLFEH